MDASRRAARLAQALADPLRLTLLQQLMAGPATVAELAEVTGAGQPNVSNHLALLRAERLVTNERHGRQMVYQIRDAQVAELVETLAAVAGSGPRLAKHQTPMIAGRTCYDHLAGKLGVAVFTGLVEAGAILPPDIAGGAVQLGPSAQAVFGKLGVDLAGTQRAKRKFAFGCLDWTERELHLGGALGAALCARCVEAEWVERTPGTRAVRLTPAGSVALARQLGITVQPSDG
jgi:DNA-binding transcriptional ArsR family regulator